MGGRWWWPWEWVAGHHIPLHGAPPSYMYISLDQITSQKKNKPACFTSCRYQLSCKVNNPTKTKQLFPYIWAVVLRKLPAKGTMSLSKSALSYAKQSPAWFWYMASNTPLHSTPLQWMQPDSQGSDVDTGKLAFKVFC